MGENDEPAAVAGQTDTAVSGQRRRLFRSRVIAPGGMRRFRDWVDAEGMRRTDATRRAAAADPAI